MSVHVTAGPLHMHTFPSFMEASQQGSTNTSSLCQEASLQLLQCSYFPGASQAYFSPILINPTPIL